MVIPPDGKPPARNLNRLRYLRDEELKRQIQAQAETVARAIDHAASSIREITGASQELAATSQDVARASAEAAQQVKDTAQILSLYPPCGGPDQVTGA